MTRYANRFSLWQRPEPPPPGEDARGHTAQVQGRPPASRPAGVFDAFIFDAADPPALMRDIAAVAGAPVLPPRWALGYMQSHRDLRDATLSSEELLLDVVDTFRAKRIPVDAVIYLGIGFTPTGWNTEQPSFDFNPAATITRTPHSLRRIHGWPTARHTESSSAAAPAGGSP